MRAWIGLLALAVLLGGCSFSEDRDRGERAVEQFHDLFRAERYAEIYANTTENFREATTEEDFAEFLGAIRRKLGNVRESELTEFEVNYSASGTSIWLGYETAYELGTATEQFVWVADGETTRLEGYRIDSKDLIIR
jgi:hypothetical protein